LSLREKDGGIVILSLWRAGKKVTFVEEEVSPKGSSERGLREIQKFAEEFGCK